jgi:hypothetical protein
MGAGALIMDILNAQAATEDHLPWHKPEVQVLVIPMDTAAGPTGPDAFSGIEGPTHG